MHGSASSVELRELLKSKVNQEAFVYYERLGRVRRYTLNHYAEPVALEDVARVAAMERTSFSTFFHRKTGVCFHDWLAAVRVAKAMSLMASGNLPVREVGRAVGLENVRTFERTFLRMAGCPPIEYKISVRPS